MNAWGEPAEKLAYFADQMGINYAVLLDGRSVAQKYGVQGIPATLLIDREGTIVHRETGFSPAVAKQLTARVETLVSG